MISDWVMPRPEWPGALPEDPRRGRPELHVPDPPDLEAGPAGPPRRAPRRRRRLPGQAARRRRAGGPPGDRPADPRGPGQAPEGRNARLSEIAHSDELTGVRNRRQFRESLAGWRSRRWPAGSAGAALAGDGRRQRVQGVQRRLRPPRRRRGPPPVEPRCAREGPENDVSPATAARNSPCSCPAPTHGAARARPSGSGRSRPRPWPPGRSPRASAPTLGGGLRRPWALGRAGRPRPLSLQARWGPEPRQPLRRGGARRPGFAIDRSGLRRYRVGRFDLGLEPASIRPGGLRRNLAMIAKDRGRMAALALVAASAFGVSQARPAQGTVPEAGPGLDGAGRARPGPGAGQYAPPGGQADRGRLPHQSHRRHRDRQRPGRSPASGSPTSASPARGRRSSRP